MTTVRNDGAPIDKEGARVVAFYDKNAAVYDNEMAAHNFVGPAELASNVHKYVKGKVFTESLVNYGGCLDATEGGKRFLNKATLL